MEITYPFAKVFVDSTNKLNLFFLYDVEHSTFQQIGEIGTGIVDFCEFDFTQVQKKIQAAAADGLRVNRGCADYCCVYCRQRTGTSAPYSNQGGSTVTCAVDVYECCIQRAD